MLTLSKNRSDNASLPLWSASFCLDCELISHCRADECPVCNSRSLISLARVLGGSLFARREQPFREDGLFDVTIAIDLQQMNAKDVTTVLERLTGVIGPKLARDQATYRVSVQPAASGVRLQRSLCFPDQDAAA